MVRSKNKCSYLLGHLSSPLPSNFTTNQITPLTQEAINILHIPKGLCTCSDLALEYHSIAEKVNIQIKMQIPYNLGMGIYGKPY